MHLSDPLAMLDEFAPKIKELEPGPIPFSALAERFTLFEEGRLRICYAPFGGINRRAKVVIVGITPGWQQVQIVMEAVRKALLAGCGYERALAIGEVEASFVGQMRTNLCRMLDQLGLAGALGIGTTGDFFGAHERLCNSTSAIRYPVFVNGQNYTGTSPEILRSPLLRRFIEEVLAPELELFPHALIVPCGDRVSACLEYLGQRARIDAGRVLIGFPHPSGSNGHRVRLFSERREAMAHKIRDWLRDRAPA